MKQLILIFLLSATVFIRASETSVFGDSLYLIPRAVAISAGDRILLKDVVTIINCPVEWEKRVNDVSIGAAAAPGQTRAMQRLEIVNALRKIQFTGSVDVGGTEDIAVVAASQMVTGKSIVDAVTQDVQQRFKFSPDTKFQIETLLTPPDQELRPGKIEYQPEWPRGGPQPGVMSVRVRLIQESCKVAEALVTVKLRIFGPVTCTTDSVRAGDLLTERNVATVQREMTAGNATNSISFTAAVGLRARTDLEPGQAVTRSSVVEPLLIRRGETVSLRVRSGALIISAHGEAKNDAARGELVRIQCPQSDGDIQARATGVREARIGE
ncbi:MAG: flagellar basal body P-ring formation chaperone FlgA [Planctomycetota bacterium]